MEFGHDHDALEFFIRWTTLPMKWQKRSPLNFFLKRDHLLVAARLARRHVARATWANNGKQVPLEPKPVCHLPGDAVVLQCQHR
jgi:hypothetical protein